ncbi:MAG: universal stress protein [Dehalococcoidia bacterium]|nr:universal stress protein [Dehalococcoidia bacterium]MCA9843332.1 universal stress protein [Dehalococcoidia bacterium]
MYRSILVPLDSTPEAERALPHVRTLQAAVGGQVTLLLVAESAETTLAAVAEMFGASGSVRAAIERENTLEAVGQAYLRNVRDDVGKPGWRLLVAEGNPAEAIAEEAVRGGHDLVVMASHARRGLGRLLFGSVADEVIRRGRVPTLVVPDEDDEEE